MNAPVGVALVGHGATASALLDAARGIVPVARLEGITALDAGCGETIELNASMCAALEKLDQGRGVVVLVDLLGASPCQCAQRHTLEHDFAVLSGLNLAMLLKVAMLDREALSPAEIVRACADSARRSVSVWPAEITEACG